MNQHGSSLKTVYSSAIKKVKKPRQLWWVHQRGSLQGADGLLMLSGSAFNCLIDREQGFVKLLHSKGFYLLARMLDSVLSATYKI